MTNIIGHNGKLGRGKSLSCVIKGYDKFLEYEYEGNGKIVYSDIPVRFKHKPLKTLEDLLDMVNEEKKEEHGIGILDELWKRADNRKCMSLLSEFTDSILLSSRKARLDIVYTQQYLQIDPRIAFITTEWRNPIIYPKNAGIENGIKPKLLYIERVDGDFESLYPLQIKCEQYLDLYDTECSPYFVKEQLSQENLRKMILRIKEQEQEIKSKR